MLVRWILSHMWPLTLDLFSILEFRWQHGQAWELICVMCPSRSRGSTKKHFQKEHIIMKRSTSSSEAYAILIGLVCLWLQLLRRFGVRLSHCGEGFWTVPAQTTPCGERLHCWLSNRKQATVRTVLKLNTKAATYRACLSFAPAGRENAASWP